MNNNIINIIINNNIVSAIFRDIKVSVSTGKKSEQLHFLLCGFMALNLLQNKLKNTHFISNRFVVYADTFFCDVFANPNNVIEKHRDDHEKIKLAEMVYLLVYKSRLFSNFFKSKNGIHKIQYSPLELINSNTISTYDEINFEQFCGVKNIISGKYVTITSHGFFRFTSRVLQEYLVGRFKNPYKYLSFLIKNANWIFIKNGCNYNKHYYDQETNSLIVLSQNGWNKFKLVTFWRGSEHSDVESKLINHVDYERIDHETISIPLKIYKIIL